MGKKILQFLARITTQRHHGLISPFHHMKSSTPLRIIDTSLQALCLGLSKERSQNEIWVHLTLKVPIMTAADDKFHLSKKNKV